MTDNHVRWGILGTAQIARKNWKAIRNCGNAIVTGVASRDAARSRQFAAECQAEAAMPMPPRAFGSYEELLASPEIDAVYIPLPTGLRKEWVIRAAQAGKHVVCEKPCAISLSDLDEMLEACRRHRVQFMDGVMFMHSGRLDRIREVLDDGVSVGPIKRIASSFSFLAEGEFLRDNIRMHSGLEPYGCLGDLGWYCIRFALWAFGSLPLSVSGRTLSQVGRPDSPAPVPTEFSAELFFANGGSAGFYCSFVAENQQWVNLSGTRGYLTVSDFVLPFFGNESTFEVTSPSFQVNGCDFNMEPHRRSFAVAEYSNSHPSAQETNLFRNFSKQVLSGQLNSNWPEIARQTQQVMNACFESACSDNRLVRLG